MPDQVDSRRSFIKSYLAAAVASWVPAAAEANENSAAKPAVQPNIILYLSDQFRWDFIGANGHNGSVHTPNIDSLVQRGTNFKLAITNQPVCAPARSVLLTSRYA